VRVRVCGGEGGREGEGGCVRSVHEKL
jgi:hypothetical protein